MTQPDPALATVNKLVTEIETIFAGDAAQRTGALQALLEGALLAARMQAFNEAAKFLRTHKVVAMTGGLEVRYATSGHPLGQLKLAVALQRIAIRETYGI